MEDNIVPSQVEDYRPGYPRYSALLASYNHFFIFRSFRQLRTRLLLSKQDEIAVLESQLLQLDRKEASPFFLGTLRGNGNNTRTELLTRIDAKLADYDVLSNRSHQMIGYSAANPRDISSLQNWLDDQGCLTETETAYLDTGNDLVSFAPTYDPAMKQVEDFVEDLLIQHYKGFREGPEFEVSSNPRVFLYSNTIVRTIATCAMLFLKISILFIPVIICVFVDNILARLFIIIASVAVYFFVLSRLAKPKMTESIAAGATFTTILIVFLSTSN